MALIIRMKYVTRLLLFLGGLILWLLVFWAFQGDQHNMDEILVLALAALLALVQTWGLARLLRS